MKIFAITDIHGSLDRLEGVADLMKKSDLVLIAGDITKSGSAKEAESVIGRIAALNAHIVAVHGNCDRPEVKDLLSGMGIGLHADGRVIGDTGFFGLGGCNPTIAHTPSEYREDEIAHFLDDGFEKIRHAATRILVSHMPPRGARDRMFLGLRTGSRSLRAFLERNEVDLCITGHIHEAHGVERFRNGVIANPGSFKTGKYLEIEIAGSIRVREGRA
jgi:uncharacterized protein